MRPVFRTLTLTSIMCAVSELALAQLGPTTTRVIRGAPGPEIGDGVVGIAIAMVALLAFVLYPRLKRSR